MNPERKVFGRMTVGKERITLGRAAFSDMLLRVSREYLKSQYRGEAPIVIELSQNELPEAFSIDKPPSVEEELFGRMVDQSEIQDEEAFPGVSVGRVIEVHESKEYERYALICDPAKRVGMDSQEVERIIQEYTDKFPDCVAHFPKWLDS